VKRVLAGADLEKVSMKMLVGSVLKEYGDKNLEDKKDYIKKLVAAVSQFLNDLRIQIPFR